jgi:hypothetical protein
MQLKFYSLLFCKPVMVAEQFKACTVFACSEAKFVGLNPS